jgi:hypothetical protein
MKPRQPDSYGLTIGGLAQLLLTVVVAACAGPTSRPGTIASPTLTATVTAPASPPPDTDQTVPPWPGDHVISSRLSHHWDWPEPQTPYKIAHQYQVPIAQPPAPPLPFLYSIGAGAHPSANPPYDQISFRFKGAFPSYEVAYTQKLVTDGSGQTVPMPDADTILRITFHQAQAHTLDGKSSTVVSAPPALLGYQALTRYAPAGDFEGVLTYGLGVGRPSSTHPRTPVRVYEVEKIEQGQHLYVIAIQLDTTQWH